MDSVTRCDAPKGRRILRIDPASARTRQAAAAGLIALALALQLWLAFRLNVNWDEFYFLSLVHDAARGSLDRPLQTFHVHLFGWLALIPADEIGQVTAGRLVMLACEAATLWLIWSTARRLTGTHGALLGVLAFLAAEFALAHAASFRADPLATALLMLVLHIVMVRRLGAPQIVLAAAAGALATLVTVKAALYAPALLGATAWRVAGADDRRDTLVRLAAVAALGLGFAAAGFFWHLGQLDPARERSALTDAGSAGRTALLAGFLPRADILAFWAPRSLLALALTGLGLMLSWHRPAPALVLLCAPLLFLVVYRNAFPYFLPFIVAPAMVVAAIGGDRLAARPAVHWALLGLVATSFLAQAARVAPHDQAAQRAVLAAVRAAFPEPVAYIDRAGMVASYPRRGFLMSSWGLGKYRDAGTPVLGELVRTAAPPFVIANGPALEAALRGLPAGPDGLLDADAALLHETYIRHWGPIWVAGAELPLEAGASHLFDIRIPGPYTLESPVAVRIDGLAHPPGAVVSLDRGPHIAEAPVAGRVTLRYGEALPRPAAAPPAEPIFWGF